MSAKRAAMVGKQNSRNSLSSVSADMGHLRFQQGVIGLEARRQAGQLNDLPGHRGHPVTHLGGAAPPPPAPLPPPADSCPPPTTPPSGSSTPRVRPPPPHPRPPPSRGQRPPAPGGVSRAT